ncbi:alcohol dehydrogenase catalytic domain-containing protein [Arthrobacter sp. ISL-85]|uniref:alcohol dehydrogenase catalytic domain-containing protein n=1 Tax=Arthrobacter sp. ISL-85 TaxID=2819115 RepID=UPI001BEA545F|nr:alcohol dehydrogenase catalytic domain-containing protein [Arthrobacter sp. ISL-85]MBT2565189.1 alcohol dehydrogenase catalytic domain-containing protein [Arthrobacter sp. ISL-85]
MPETMRAIRLAGPVGPNGLTVSQVPIPDVGPGQALIRVMAFGVNESEVTSRKGQSGPDFSFPRILGIEAVGVVDAVGEGVDLDHGQKVATMMGGLGRAIDGSYAEYVGALSGDWTIPDFSPFTIPTGVRLTSYSGEAKDLPAAALAKYLRAIEADSLDIVVSDTYAGLEKVAEAQHDLESCHRPGKRVVVLAET